jgi:transcriptional regulator with XRE-family HTH domain
MGKLICIERERAKLTQDELAQRVGLTRTSISNIEGGRQKIQVHTLYAIAEALHAPVDTLLPLTGQAIDPELFPTLKSTEGRRLWRERAFP